ncbi:D-alanyl-D-alanine carboxypeptidase [[Clostridium] spiroforme]|nr:D-alanyl-D-alanine carboxypeptidase [Thomasclavelia spiroformis]MBM6881121.1 D-alanyl-D-alanine carboxypeptidase [Thomasclavelia spiroformis]MBM6931129.1 D-alanyl-D-alanine carboxypeptidase [Thomasclavelia spiroformis]
MIKKILCLALVLGMFFFQINTVKGLTLAQNATSGILIDCDSGQILYSKDETKKLYPASTTKIMTMILMFEAIKDNRLQWDEVLSCSQYASSMGGSQVYLETNEKMTVFELFKCIAIASANDASTVMAEAIGGSHDHFVEMMNEKAKELKLINTHFVNCTGLHDSQHYTCATDLATMAKYLIEIGGKKLFSVTSLYDSYIREDTHQKFWLVNTNKLLKQYDGVDGLKTGYTKEAGYCLVTTCQKDDLRLIGVLMDESDAKTRNEEMIEMLDFGFSYYKKKTLYHKNQVVDELTIKDMIDQNVKVITKEDIHYLEYRGDENKIKTSISYDELSLPIEKNKSIGQLLILRNGIEIGKYALYSQNNVKKMSFIQKILRVYRDMI